MQVSGFYLTIPGGGGDLVYPHHESEIAQSECWTGERPFARTIYAIAADVYPVPDWPLALHRHYSRREILAAVGHLKAGGKVSTPVGGVMKVGDSKRELVTARLGKRLLEQVVHRDEALPESIAANRNPFDYAPRSRVVQDITTLAQQLIEVVTAGALR